MSLDLTGGLQPSLDYPVFKRPAVRGFGENHAFWLFDDAGQFSIVCFHLENNPGFWEIRREFGGVALPGGRVLMVQGEGPATTPQGPGGANTIFRCDEPFLRWTGTFRGTARDTTAEDLARGPLAEGPRALLELQFDAAMAAPPWVMGGLSKQAKVEMSREGGQFTGGYRYEQLFRAGVILTVNEDQYRFSATGLRTHRTGPRNTAAMVGHSWQTAVFPSGRAFGLMRFPKPDGSMGYSEGFVLKEGRLIEARIVDSPWLTALQGSGEKFRIELESELGTTVIDGETVASVFRTMVGPTDRGWIRSGIHADGHLALVHGMARFSWDGEEAYGLIERSAPVRNFAR